MDFRGSLRNTLLVAIFKDGRHIFTKLNGVRKYWITIHQNVLGTCELAQNVRSNILLLEIYDLLIFVGIIC